MSRCDDHANQLLMINRHLLTLKRASGATLVAVIGGMATIITALVAGYFQLIATRAELSKDCPAHCASSCFRWTARR